MEKKKEVERAQEDLTDEKVRAKRIFTLLKKAYPDARCTLEYRDPFTLLIMTILAAQCTDERVNKVCETLFQKYKTPQDFAQSSSAELEEAIRPCGFFKAKAKSIQATCRELVQRYGGKVPNTMEDLLTLRGVGRKTANVILGECFGQPAIIVDTHCRRVAKRLGFTKEEDPSRIEQDLMRLWDKRDWTLFSHLLVFHGRATCTARKPACDRCPVRSLCPYPRRLQEGIREKSASK